MKKIAGLDVHSKWTTFVIKSTDGKLLARGKFDTTAAGIADWAKEHEIGTGDVAGLETGTVSTFVARLLLGSGCEVRVIDAAEVRRKARSKAQKSDSLDAEEICEGLRRDQYVCVVKLPDEWTERMRSTVARRRHFVAVRTAETNAIKYRLRAQGLGHLNKRLYNVKSFDRLLSEPVLDQVLKRDIERHRRIWEAADKEVRELDQELETLAAERAPRAAVLRSIPGFGVVVSATVLAYFEDAGRFASAKHAGSYAGLVPQTYSSGESERYGHITKRGPRELRAMLVQAAQQARSPGHPLHKHYQCIARKKGHKLAVVAVAHRLARIAWAMLRDGQPFEGGRYTSKAWQELDGVAVVAESDEEEAA